LIKEKKYFVSTVVLATVLLLIGLTYGLMQWTHRIKNTATVKVVGVGIYKDVNFTVSVETIDWGILEPGETKNFSAYVKNESNVPINLTMYTEDWQPENASSFITLSWSYDGATVPVEGAVDVTFSLIVSEEVSGIESFNFVIVIVGAG